MNNRNPSNRYEFEVVLVEQSDDGKKEIQVLELLINLLHYFHNNKYVYCNVT